MSTSYTEKTHSAFHGAPIDTSDPKTLACSSAVTGWR